MAKRRKVECAVPIPKVRGRPAKRPCRICGYSISCNSFITLSCCGLFSHNECWDSSCISMDTSLLECTSIGSFLEKDRRTQLAAPAIAQPVREGLGSSGSEFIACRLCNKELELNNQDDRDHMLLACSSVDEFTEPLLGSQVENGISIDSLARRLAGISRASGSSLVRKGIG